MVVVEAVNGNTKGLLGRSRGCKNLRYVLPRARRQAVTQTGFVGLKKAAWNAGSRRGHISNFVHRQPDASGPRGK
jgi:hypothetical protein